MARALDVCPYVSTNAGAAAQVPCDPPGNIVIRVTGGHRDPNYIRFVLLDVRARARAARPCRAACVHARPRHAVCMHARPRHAACMHARPRHAACARTSDAPRLAGVLGCRAERCHKGPALLDPPPPRMVG